MRWSLARLPILLLGTARPGFRHTWADHTYFHRLAIEPLADEHTDALIRDSFRPYDASAALKALIHERTEGNPFFVEELLHTLQEQELVALQDEVCLERGRMWRSPPSRGLWPHRPVATRGEMVPAGRRRHR